MNDKTPEQLRDDAQGIVALSLQIPTGQARLEVQQLIDEEVVEICAVGADALHRREVTKAVIGRAYDRRRDAAAKDAKKKVTAAAAPVDPPPAPEVPPADAAVDAP